MIKRYHPPVPPATRVLEHIAVTEADKERLRALQKTADPVELFASLRAAQEELGKRFDRRGLHAKAEEPLAIDLQSLATNLKTAWKK